MRRGWLTKVLFLSLTAGATPAFAQDWSQPWADPEDRPAHVDLSISAGFLMPTRWSSLVLLGSVSPVSGVLEQVVSRDLRVEPDKEFAAGVTYWRSRYGFRTQVGFSRSSLTIGSAVPAGDSSPASVNTTSINLDTWLYDIRAAIGWVDYLPTRRVWPYAFIGLGGITYDLNRSVPPAVLTFIQRGGTQTGAASTIVVADARDVLLAANDLKVETVFAFNFGVGTDLRVPMGPSGIALRLEVSDHVAPSPVGLRIDELSRAGAIVADGRGLFGAVHHLSATAGFVVQIGR